MQLIETSIPDIKLLVPKRFTDIRGSFYESWNEKTLAGLGIAATFVQDNHAHSHSKGTVRGLHYQINPMAQGKLLSVVRGSVLDIAVDIRPDSPSFGRHVAAELSAANGQQIWVPAGFAHGYCTLEDNSEVQYKVTNFYSPVHERGIVWNDPDLAIDWPVTAATVLLAERDAKLPRLRDASRLSEPVQ